MNIKSASVGFVLLAIVIVVALFLLSALITMWLVNIVLGQYDIELLNYGSAMAITALLWGLGGASKINGKD